MDCLFNLILFWLGIIMFRMYLMSVVLFELLGLRMVEMCLGVFKLRLMFCKIVFGLKDLYN